MKGDCVEDETVIEEPTPGPPPELITDGETAFYMYTDDEGTQQDRTVIGATVIESNVSDGNTQWRLTLDNGDTVNHVTNSKDDGVIKEVLSELPPAAIPNTLLTEDEPADIWNPTKPPQVFERREPIDLEEQPEVETPNVDALPRNPAWKDPEDVSKTIAVRSSNYGLYVDQAAVELQIKQAFENTPNWNKLKPDARCALDMIATKVSRILTGKPDLHDSWHDIQGYAKLVADRIQRDIEGMGGSL